MCVMCVVCVTFADVVLQMLRTLSNFELSNVIGQCEAFARHERSIDMHARAGV